MSLYFTSEYDGKFCRPQFQLRQQRVASPFTFSSTSSVRAGLVCNIYMYDQTASLFCFCSNIKHSYKNTLFKSVFAGNQCQKWLFGYQECFTEKKETKRAVCSGFRQIFLYIDIIGFVSPNRVSVLLITMSASRRRSSWSHKAEVAFVHHIESVFKGAAREIWLQILLTLLMLAACSFESSHACQNGGLCAFLNVKPSSDTGALNRDEQCFGRQKCSFNGAFCVLAFINGVK